MQFETLPQKKVTPPSPPMEGFGGIRLEPAKESASTPLEPINYSSFGPYEESIKLLCEGLNDPKKALEGIETIAGRLSMLAEESRDKADLDRLYWNIQEKITEPAPIESKAKSVLSLLAKYSREKSSLYPKKFDS